LVDGLDQIESPGGYITILNGLLRISLRNLIVASRPFAVADQEGNSNVKFLRLKPFDVEAQKSYFGDKHERASKLCASCLEMLGIPMLAYMVRFLIGEKRDEKITNRTGLYKHFIDHILKEYKHDNLTPSWEDKMGVRQVLCKISYEALAAQEPSIQKIPLSDVWKGERHSITIDKILKYGLVSLIINRSKGTNEFLYFSHQSFQEYLAAEYVGDNEQSEQDVIRDATDPKWKNVIKFLAGRKEGKFIEKLAFSRFNEDVHHTRLFLAAECCAELNKQCNVEKAIFARLKNLLKEKAFYQKALGSLAYLNIKEALDLLINLSVQRASFHFSKWKEDLHLEAFNTLKLVKGKMSVEQIHRLLEQLIKPDSPYSLDTIRYNLKSIADVFSAEHIDMVIDYKFSAEAIQYFKDLQSKVSLTDPCDYIPIGVWLYYSKESSIKQINWIIQYLASDDPDVRFMAVTTISDIIKTHEIFKLRVVNIIPDTKVEQSKKLQQSDYLPLEFSFSHIDILMQRGRTDIECVQLEICWIMTHLAGLKVLSLPNLDWLIEMLKKGSPECQTAIDYSSEIIKLSENLGSGQEILRGLKIIKGEGGEPSKFSYVRLTPYK